MSMRNMLDMKNRPSLKGEIGMTRSSAEFGLVGLFGLFGLFGVVGLWLFGLVCLFFLIGVG